MVLSNAKGTSALIGLLQSGPPPAPLLKKLIDQGNRGNKEKKELGHRAFHQ